MKKTPTRVRFAPSPTGAIHVGGARTALFNWLYAKQHNGTFVLRIEDTDTERSKPESERQIFDGFHWLGLAWDEGPDVGGPHGPYRQSERTDLYTHYLQQLLDAQKIYPCFCTHEELEAERTAQENQGTAPLYSGKCRALTSAERERRLADGQNPIYRFATGIGPVTVHDLIRGDVTFHAEHLGDFSVARSMTEPLYNFAVVVDDALMQITHVIRGEEHLSNTPKQLLLYQALDMTPPVFAHLPLLLGTNRKKLSKRDAATSIVEYRDAGYLPEALMNFLALLGWHPKDERELFSIEELVQHFRLDDVQKGGAIFDTAKLRHLSGLYIRSLNPQQIIGRAGERLAAARAQLGDRLPDAILLARERAVTINEVVEGIQLFVALPAYERGLLIPKGAEAKQTRSILTSLHDLFTAQNEEAWTVQTLHDAAAAWMQQNIATNAETLWPLRIALSGLKNSPGVFDIAYCLGKRESLGRITRAIQALS